jgi:hypothetical protein
VLVAVIFIAAFRRDIPEEEVRALTFFSLVLTIVSLIFVNRSFSASLVTALRRPNPALASALLAVTTMLSLTLLWPFASGLFRFGPLHLDDLALTVGAGVFVLVLLELLKPLWRERLGPNRTQIAASCVRMCACVAATLPANSTAQGLCTLNSCDGSVQFRRFHFA